MKRENRTVLLEQPVCRFVAGNRLKKNSNEKNKVKVCGLYYHTEGYFK